MLEAVLECISPSILLVSTPPLTHDGAETGVQSPRMRARRKGKWLYRVVFSTPGTVCMPLSLRLILLEWSHTMNSSFTESELGEIKELFDQVSKVLRYPGIVTFGSVCVSKYSLWGRRRSARRSCSCDTTDVFDNFTGLMICKRCLVRSQHKLPPNTVVVF